MSVGTREFQVSAKTALLLTIALLASTVGASAAEPGTDNLPLRVCADPGNMPLSNKKGEGFQNKVAEILAKGIGTTLEYYWYPYYGRGLARSTINADHCDVLMDVPSDYEMALVTKPYYKSTFVLAYRHDRNHRIDSLDDPILKKWRIGVLQSSPAREALRAHGVQENTDVHYVFYDSTYNPQDHPGIQVEQVIGGSLDAVEAWGPVAGYYVAKQNAPLDIVPLNTMDSSIPLEFSMSLGVRRTDKDLKKRLDAAFEANKDAIKAVLVSYGVPLLQCADCVISGTLPAHGPYAELEKANLEARGDHPQSSPSELAATKKRLGEGADPSKELADAGMLRDLGPLWDSAKLGDNLTDAWKALGSQDGTLYGITYTFGDRSAMFYKTASMAKAGITEQPKTWDEFVANFDKLNKAGITPIAIGAKVWSHAEWFESIYEHLNGVDKAADLAAHKIPWTDDSVKATLKKWAELIKAGCCGDANTMLAMDWDNASDAVLAAGTHGYQIIGMWNNDRAQSNDGLKQEVDYNIVQFPAMGAGHDDVSSVDSKEFSGLTTGSNQAAADAFLAWITTADAANIVAQHGLASPSNKVDSSLYGPVVKYSVDAVSKDKVQFVLGDLLPGDLVDEYRVQLQKFLQDPSDANIDAVTQAIEAKAATAY